MRLVAHVHSAGSDARVLPRRGLDPTHVHRGFVGTALCENTAAGEEGRRLSAAWSP